MTDRTCLADLCTSTELMARGLCRKHYQRLMKHGSYGDDSPRECPGCLAQFSPRRSDQKYCTRECGLRTRSRLFQGLAPVVQKTRACQWCDTEFTHLDGRRLFCSPECARISSLLSEIETTYGLTKRQYRDMWVAQGGRCAICRREESYARCERLAVDHCHDTGRVRGLLCQDCNRGLGLLRDSAETVLAAAIYLEASASA